MKQQNISASFIQFQLAEQSKSRQPENHEIQVTL